MKTALKATDFVVQIHALPNRTETLCVNILENGKFNINGKLNEKLKERIIKISFTADGKHFMLVETNDSEDGIRFPKSGSRKLPEVYDLLKKNKIPFPANYSVWNNEGAGFWQGDYSGNPIQTKKSLGSK